MPFIPHTETDVQAMLDIIGADSVDELFDEIPKELKISGFTQLPEGLSEMALNQEMKRHAQKDEGAVNFIGAGAYEHHVPAAVWDIAGRGEFLTAYTPYQAEASQGTLQVIYEYQSMMVALTGLDISNSSLYDGASATAEAILMAIRSNRKCPNKRVLVAGTLHPFYLQTIRTLVASQGIEIVVIPFHDQAPFNTSALQINSSELDRLSAESFAALVIPQPNFFGVLESVHALTDWAHNQHALVIAVVNPLALLVSSPPGDWGSEGADIAVGEGQPLGIPLASGGPYFGFLCCKKSLVRQMPGRVIGRTVDLDGREGFTLTLQAREQHIRRSKATSNICTNQGLAVTAATIYMSLMGTAGLRKVARACFEKAHDLARKVSQIPGVDVVPVGQYFHEFVVLLPRSARLVLEHMAQQQILAGFDLSSCFPQLGEAILVCATEMRTEEDCTQYVDALQQSLLELESVSC